MTRRADPDRIHQARRGFVVARLTASGAVDPETAERWCDAWEDEAALQGVDRSSVSFWIAGENWIEARRERWRERS